MWRIEDSAIAHVDLSSRTMLMTQSLSNPFVIQVMCMLGWFFTIADSGKVESVYVS